MKIVQTIQSIAPVNKINTLKEFSWQDFQYILQFRTTVVSAVDAGTTVDSIAVDTVTTYKQ